MRLLHLMAPYADKIVAELRDLPHDLEVRVCADVAALVEAGRDVEALVCFPHLLDQAILDAFPYLKWLQALSSGVDALARLDMRGIAISTMAGVQGPQMAELAFLFMLGFARDIRALIARQGERRWGGAAHPRALAGAQLTIIGVGRIAEELACRAQAFGMVVTGVSGSRVSAPHFDRVVPVAALKAAAAEADYLVVLAPYTAANHQLVSSEVIASMRPDSVLINLSRGQVVDEAALILALQSGAIAGAGLDVFTHEPLPADSPLWNMPNVLISPHLGGWSTRFPQQVAPIIADNARRWFGKPKAALINAIQSSHR
jgi:phosphoglycerate dehydrogenase-like enzyme